MKIADNIDEDMITAKKLDLRMRKLIIFPLLFALSACSLFGRSNEDIYENDPELLDYYQEKQKQEKSQAKAQIRAFTPRGELNEEVVERRDKGKRRGVQLYIPGHGP